MTPEELARDMAVAVYGAGTDSLTASVRKDGAASLLPYAEALLGLREALKPFAHFARQWDRQPMRGYDEQFYGIHTGTEYAADLSVPDMRSALAALESASRLLGESE